MLSLALHALLGLLWGRGEVVSDARSTAAPIVLELIERPAPRAPPAAPPPRAEPIRTRPPRPARAPLAQRAPVPASTPSPGPPPASPPDAPAAPLPPDAPSAVRLFPGPRGLPVMPEAEKPAGGGRTWRPGEGPSAQERLAEERERVRGRVQGFLEEDLAVARVEGGLVDPYFSQMRKALEKGMKDAPLFGYQGVVDQLRPTVGSRGARQLAQSYGATGTPAEVPQGPSGSDRLEEVARAGTAGARARAQPAPTYLERLERRGEDAHELELEVELEQSPSGQVLSVKLLRGSGNPSFDEYVLTRVPGSLATLDPAAASFAARTRAPTVRSAWNVRGRVSFARTIKLSQLHKLGADDAAYVAALLATQNFGGGFDETRGEVTISDVRRPHFDVRTRLLRVY